MRRLFCRQAEKNISTPDTNAAGNVIRSFAAGTELTGHLGYEKHVQGEKINTKRRNGKTTRELRTNDGPMRIEVPRDREGTFEPQIVPKHQEKRSFHGVPCL
jgi:transposase-like protein